MTDSMRAAQRFWNLLDRPPEFNNEESGRAWALIMADCQGEAEMDIDTFLEFIRHCCKTHAYSAEYLRNARDPAVTFKKNLPSLLKRFNSFKAALAAKADRESKLTKKADRKEVLHTPTKFNQVEV